VFPTACNQAKIFRSRVNERPWLCKPTRFPRMTKICEIALHCVGYLFNVFTGTCKPRLEASFCWHDGSDQSKLIIPELRLFPEFLQNSIKKPKKLFPIPWCDLSLPETSLLLLNMAQMHYGIMKETRSFFQHVLHNLKNGTVRLYVGWYVHDIIFLSCEISQCVQQSMMDNLRHFEALPDATIMFREMISCILENLLPPVWWILSASRCPCIGVK